MNRAYSICSSWINLDLKINKLRQYFTNNYFPLNLLETKIEHFLHNSFVGKPKELYKWKTNYIFRTTFIIGLIKLPN